MSRILVSLEDGIELKMMGWTWKKIRITMEIKKTTRRKSKTSNGSVGRMGQAIKNGFENLPRIRIQKDIIIQYLLLNSLIAQIVCENSYIKKYFLQKNSSSVSQNISIHSHLFVW